VEFVKAKYGYFDGKNRPNIIVVHTIEYPLNKKGAEWCADFFAGNKGLTAPKASAHYTVDMDSAVQCVKDEDGAWHTPGKIRGVEINRQSIGIEHAGYAKFTEAEWASEDARAMLEVSAELVAQLCYEHRISVIRLTHEQLRAGESGICGHVDCSKVAGGTHWDPGPNFPWEHYMERVIHYYELHEFMVHGKLLVEPPRHVSSLGVDIGVTVPRISQTCDWVIVEHEGKRYRVSPYYMPYVSIGGAAKMAEEAGWIIPTPGLVDAIWRQADLKIDGNA
jgi:N-acetyl-anhydromuramyl-L-alanine amidase AmpD